MNQSLPILITRALIIIFAAFSTVSCAGFTSGNFLVVKGELSSDQRCAKGYIAEITRAGEIVQEIALPSQINDGTHPCLVYPFAGYNSRLTVANDGFRAIIPCCKYVNETDSYLISFAVINGTGQIQTTTPFDVDNSTISGVYNAVLDGEDVWLSVPGAIYYTTLTSNTSTLVFSGDVLTIRSYEGNLFATNYEGLGESIVQIGEGLPKTLVTSTTIFLNQTWDTDAFEFSENYLAVGNYSPMGLFILNRTTHEVMYSNEVFGEVVQLVIFEDNTILAHVDGDSGNGLYEFTFGDDINVPNGTVWLSGYNTSAYYYSSIIKAPQDSCQDNVTNFDETDVDCGGSLCLARCVDGKACSLASDCSSNVCKNGVCVSPTPTSTPTSSPIFQKSPTATSAASTLISLIPIGVLLGTTLFM